MRKVFSFIVLLLMLGDIYLFAQIPQKDKGIFKEYKPGYYENSILKGIEEFQKKDEQPKVVKRFKIDLTGMDIPTDVKQFKTYWHNDPVSQGNTSTCWCFSATSYFESEIYRLTNQKVKLSEIYTVYWEYVERARRYVCERGNSAFAEGSEANAVTRIWKTYGIVPLKDYTGLQSGQIFHTHDAMFNEMEGYLKSVKAANAWNEDVVIATIKSILNHYIGEPPTKIMVNGKSITPQDYLKNVLKVNLDDYVDVLSVMQQPYWQKVEYTVPDNWWHSKDYCNIPLDDYMKVIKQSLEKGYTIAVGGDVSEAGFESGYQVAVVPTFDIPSAYIDENARQFRFGNGTTTDDHGLHIVGYMEKNGTTWYVLKDSGAGSRLGGKDNNKNFGYYFMREDYMKLKMMDFMVHKDMMKDYLPLIK